MGKTKVRCPQCGAKNDEVEMCRICGLLLPCAEAIRRRGTATDGTTFNANVEREREAWRAHLDGHTSAGSRSRRPAALPTAPPAEWNAPADPFAPAKPGAGGRLLRSLRRRGE